MTYGIRWNIIGFNENGEFYDSLSTAQKYGGVYKAQCPDCLTFCPCWRKADVKGEVYASYLAAVFRYCPHCGADMIEGKDSTQ